MKKIIIIFIIISIVALFIVPEKKMGEYKGLIALKKFVVDASITVKTTATSLLKGEPVKNDLKESIKQSADEAIERGKETVEKNLKDILKDWTNQKIEQLNL